MRLERFEHRIALDAIVLPRPLDQACVKAARQLEHHDLIDDGNVELARLSDQNQAADDRLGRADPAKAQTGRDGLGEGAEVDDA